MRIAVPLLAALVLVVPASALAHPIADRHVDLRVELGEHASELTAVGNVDWFAIRFLAIGAEALDQPDGSVNRWGWVAGANGSGAAQFRSHGPFDPSLVVDYAKVFQPYFWPADEVVHVGTLRHPARPFLGAAAGEFLLDALGDPLRFDLTVSLKVGAHHPAQRPYFHGGGPLDVYVSIVNPEPGSLLLLGAGIAALASLRRRAR